MQRLNAAAQMRVRDPYSSIASSKERLEERRNIILKGFN
jgi:hypothetical protein